MAGPVAKKRWVGPGQCGGGARTPPSVIGSAASSGQPLSPSLLVFSQSCRGHRAVHDLYVNLYERDLTQTSTETRMCMFTVGTRVCVPGSVHSNTQKPGRLPLSRSPESLLTPMSMITALMEYISPKTPSAGIREFLGH